MKESRYVDKKGYLSRYVHTLAVRRLEGKPESEFGSEAEWLRRVRDEFPGFIPFLRRKCGVDFRGRVLEIGAGSAWFSAVLSKLPNVVEITGVDLSPRVLKEQAPKIFRLLQANTAKITRMPGDFHKLDFPANHFDFVVCSAALHRAVNMVQALREVKRVLKPGGQFVSIREPVLPLVNLKSRRRKGGAVDEGGHRRFTVGEYREFFKQAAFPMRVEQVSLARGFRYYVDRMVNGLTQAQYAFIATKRTIPERPKRPRVLAHPTRLRSARAPSP